MSFNPGDVVEIKSCQSIFTQQHRVSIVGEIIEVQKDSVTITTGRDKLTAGIIDIELTNKPFHRSCH
jgi:hypothetical protein